MLSTIGASYAASPEYAAKLQEKGYHVGDTFKDGLGNSFTHSDVHEAFEKAYIAHRQEHLQRCGASTRDNEKIRKKWRKAVEGDVKDGFHLSWETIGFAVLMTLVGGPVGFIVAVITVLFEYYLTKDLEGDKAFRTALAIA